MRLSLRAAPPCASCPAPSLCPAEHVSWCRLHVARVVGTTGLYGRKDPVAILDFASLYPSIYRAHNLCYSTLVHKDDAHRLPAEQLTTTPTGAELQRGVGLQFSPRPWGGWGSAGLHDQLLKLLSLQGPASAHSGEGGARQGCMASC